MLKAGDKVRVISCKEDHWWYSDKIGEVFVISSPIHTGQGWHVEGKSFVWLDGSDIELVIEEAESFNPIYCRDRIKEVDALIESLEEERVSLVQALEDEGFYLIERVNKQLEECKQSHEDMSDWNNWKVGDLVEVIGLEGGHKFYVGDVVRIKELFDKDGRCGCCEYTDHRDYWFLNAPSVKFHSRPTK